MNVLFLTLLLLSIFCLIAGLIKPTWFNKIFIGRANRKITTVAFGAAVIVCFTLVGITTPVGKQVASKNQTPAILKQGSTAQATTTPTATGVTAATTTAADPNAPLSDSAYFGLVKIAVLSPIQEFGQSLTNAGNDISNLDFDNALTQAQLMQSDLSAATFGLNEVKDNVPADLDQANSLLTQTVNTFVKADNILIPGIKNRDMATIQAAINEFQSGEQTLRQFESLVPQS